jgi:hypothetical protein
LTQGGSNIEEELTVTISDLLGVDVCDCVPDNGLDRLEEGLSAALALGIAYGLLVRPEAFGIGGAR